MTSFITLYRGETVGEAKIIALSADPDIVADFASRLLQSSQNEKTDDPILGAIQQGKTRALRLIATEDPSIA